jgi:hypothetical protein
MDQADEMLVPKGFSASFNRIIKITRVSHKHERHLRSSGKGHRDSLVCHPRCPLQVAACLGRGVGGSGAYHGQDDQTKDSNCSQTVGNFQTPSERMPSAILGLSDLT